MYLNGRDHLGVWTPVPGQNTGHVVGLPAFVVAGATATARALDATSSPQSRFPRLGYVGTGATAGSILTIRHNLSWLFTENASKKRGFTTLFRFAISDATDIPAARMFLGLRSATAALTNVAPSTLTNSIGIGHNSGDANLSIYYGGTTAQAPINLGSDFPSARNHLYEVMFASYGEPGSYTTINWQVTRLAGAASKRAVGKVFRSSDIDWSEVPSDDLALGFNAFRSNNTGTGAVSLDLLGLRMESLGDGI